jgi:hypothetical protein
MKIGLERPDGLMPRVTIQLSPDDLKYVEEELTSGAARLIDDLFDRAVQDCRTWRGLEELARLVQEAIDRGEPSEITPDYWERQKREFLARRRS